MTESILSPVWVIIPAAGVGKRMQLDLPKQYLKIENKTIIEHTLACFINYNDIAGIVVALDADDPYWKLLNIESNSTPVYTVEGGSERPDSVMQALDYLIMVEKVPNDSWVLVHDAARPCLSRCDLDALLDIRAYSKVGGILASRVRDTMKRSLPGKKQVLMTESRTDLWHALTPQMFRLGQLKKAMQSCHERNIQMTDEASAIEVMGDQPELVEGSYNNIKITLPSDIELATCLLNHNNDTSVSS
jgi:2-C-methyl-D-erythritol 4-phosphate cytidylyltransferase